jgi:radical SAM protein with 4Fe4S-binding SPASM domain
VRSRPADDFFDTLADRARRARTPEGATFELTYGCNLRCVHCYNPTHRVLPHELTTAEVCSILEQCAELGLVTICFSGGELFVRPDVFAIFERAERLGLILELITNATRITPAIAERLRQVAFRQLGVSIYGATKPTYERVTAVPGSYDRFLAGLRCLVWSGLPVAVRMPVLTVNAHEVGKAQALVEGMGLRFQYCLDIAPRSDGDPAPLAHRLSPADKLRMDLAMKGDRLAAADEASCRASDDFLGCACGRSRFAITPYGEMNLCVAFPTPRYDLRKGSVREGWEVLKRTVDEARPGESYECPGCDVRSVCRQGRSDAWLETGDMSACLPHYRALAILEKDLRERGHLRRAD